MASKVYRKVLKCINYPTYRQNCVGCTSQCAGVTCLGLQTLAARVEIGLNFTVDLPRGHTRARACVEVGADLQMTGKQMLITHIARRGVNCRICGTNKKADLAGSQVS